MNRQSINKAQKSNAAALESSGLLQRKTINQTALDRSIADSKQTAAYTAADTIFNHDLSTIPVRSSGMKFNTDKQIEHRIPFRINIPCSSDNEKGMVEPEDHLLIEEIPAPEQVISSSQDDILPMLSYVTGVARSAVVPRGFGVTNTTNPRYRNIGITTANTTYTVTGDAVWAVTWNVRAGVGPRSEVDIANEKDPSITSANYTTVASDLMPNMSDLNGRPPRSNFWAEDLTERHELFHTVQRTETFGKGSMLAMQNWLLSQTANSAPHIQNTLLPRALAEGVRVYNAYVAAPTTEGDAYKDGAPLYTARSKAITLRGQFGGYP